MSARQLIGVLLGFALGCGGSAGPAKPGGDAGSRDGAVAPVDSATSSSSTDAASSAGDAGTSTALVNPAPGSKLFIGTNFWNVDWEGQADFFASGVDFATTTNPWNPALLTDLAPYSVLRFMDWNQINDDPNPQAVWSTRTQKTASQGEPVAFEWQIDLCNRTMKDYWLNIPSQASSTYWTQLAQLVHDSLDPSLRVYLEWSNEVWNGSFPQHGNAQTQGSNLKLAGSDTAMSYQVYESVRMWEAFEAVFGKDSPRLVKVIAGQAAYTGPCMNQATAFKDSTINPNGTMPDVYAVAPYFQGTSISALQSAVTTTVQWTKSDVTCAKSIGVPLVSYEGGSDSSAGDCSSLQVDPGMHDLYVTYLDQQASAGLTGPFMQYTHSGSCWGLKVKPGDSSGSSPKYKGVTDWLAANP